MIGISIWLLTGRYHATPWDHQVNEGVVEFPPSPWRILRALVAAAYRLPEFPARDRLCELLTLLADQLPLYHVPRHTAAHTRHYMPIIKEGKPASTKVIDTFYALPGGALSADAKVEVVWQGVSLSIEQRQLLEQLCQQVSYLGRAESWAELQVMEPTISVSEWTANLVPLTAAADPSSVLSTARSTALVGDRRILAPLSQEGFVGFRQALALLPQPKQKRKAWTVPQDLLAALELDVGEMHRQGWNGIPGTRWVDYVQPIASVESPVESPVESRLWRSTVQPPLTFARFVLASPVLPKVTQAVSIGERLRQALIKHSRDEAEHPSSVFSGKPGVGETQDFRKGQGHAWYLPEVNGRGQIEQMVVYAREGFDQSQSALSALGSLRRLWGNEGFDLRAVLVNLGQVAEYADLPTPGYRVIGQSQRWRSLTPMVLSRFPKKKLIPGTSFLVDSVEHQALRMLLQLPHLQLVSSLPIDSQGAIDPGFWQSVLQGQEQIGFVEQQKEDEEPSWLALSDRTGEFVVRVRQTAMGVTRYKAIEFQRQRYHGEGKKAMDQGFWLELEFAQPQQGPIALGYAAHFGLGVFVPIYSE